MKPPVMIWLLFIGLCGCTSSKILSPARLKPIIDSAAFRYHPHPDLLPEAFQTNTKENEYYFQYPDLKSHVTVIRLRENLTCTYETYYQPYHWARIDYRIGHYRLSGDTVLLSYQPLLKGDPASIYVQPTLRVSWIPPLPPAYLLLHSGSLYEAGKNRIFRYLNGHPAFLLEKQK